MPRVRLVDEHPEDPQLQAVFSRVQASWDHVPNLYRTLGHAPDLLEKWVDFAWALRADATTPRALRELAILRTAQLNGADYEWRHHVPMAIEAGVGDAQLADLATWASSTAFGDEERAVLAMAEELAATARLGDQGWASLRAHFDEDEAMELVLTAAFYACVSRVLGGLAIEVEERYADVPPVADPG